MLEMSSVLYRTHPFFLRYPLIIEISNIFEKFSFKILDVFELLAEIHFCLEPAKEVFHDTVILAVHLP